MKQHPINDRWQALDRLSVLVAALDVQGHLVFVNASFENTLSRSRRSLIGLHFAELLADPENFDNVLQGAQQHAFAALRFEAHLLRANGDPLPVHVHLSAPDQPNHEIWVEIWPIEQQVRLDREERLREQAQEHKELVRNMAHEIKNPLGGIRGSAQLLEMELGDPSLLEYTRVIVHEADRLQSLVDRLLAPHRQPHALALVNIHEICEHVRSLVLAEFPEGLRIERDYDASLPELMADRAQLVQVILNVVQNAAQVLKARRAQGDAVITLRTRVARQLTFGRRRHRLALQLHVIDNGPGVPPELRDRIFYPLVSGREGGTGLGLSLAQTFVQQHQGTIECESVPGKTDFRIVLPLS